MIKQLINTTIKNTLFLTVVLLTTASVLAAEPTSEQTAPTSEAKREKTFDSVVTLAEVASLAERWLKMKVLAGDKADYKIHMNLNKDTLTYGQFLTQLNINGFTAYKSNDYILIIPNREARNLSIPIADKHKTYADDEYVTDVLTTKKACANRVLAVIRPLIPQYGHLSVYEEGNALIVVDTYGNIQRVKTVIKALDESLDEKEECNKIKKTEGLPEKK
jgi:type II secretory pathway component GspD/PulD (secretin)